MSSVLRTEIMDIFYGVYDVQSAVIVSEYTNNLFLSGLSFAASYYGLPDIGFVTWQDMVGLCSRIHQRLANARILVDIDDGFGGPDVAIQVTHSLRRAGAFGVVLEDQLRPKKCGHLPGKKIQPLKQYLETLTAVLDNKEGLFVVARTDADVFDEQVNRIKAISELPVDAILVDGIDLHTLAKLKKHTSKPICFNYLEGGLGGKFSVFDTQEAGVNLMILSTPCITAARKAIDLSVGAIHREVNRDAQQPAPEENKLVVEF